MDSNLLRRLAVPTVCCLIGFLAYGSQLLFEHIKPGPLTTQQRLVFNTLVAYIWISYARAILTDPGHVPTTWKPEQLSEDGESLFRQRHCRKCAALKPPRAHHCKVCKRCQIWESCSNPHADRRTDASPKWITIVPGRLIVFLISPFPTSCGFCFTLLLQ